MNIDFMTALIYLFSAIFQIFEFFLPWIEYCAIQIFPANTLSTDTGLALDDISRKTYLETKLELCGSFKKIIENACSGFCFNLDKFYYAGIIASVGISMCIILSMIYAINFYLIYKNKKHLQIPHIIA